MATSSSSEPGRVAYVLALLVTLGACVWVATRDQPVTLGGDNAMLEHPVLADAYRQIQGGHVPRWSVGRWGGSPLVADPVIGALYLPYYFGYAATPFPHLRAIDVIACLHLGLLLVGVVWLAAGLGVGTSGAIVAAGAVALSPTLVHVARSWIEYWAALAWWPWLFGAMLRFGATARPGFAVLAALALAAQVYAGYPQFALYSGVVALALAVVARPGPIGRRVTAAAVIGAGGVLLAAPPLLAGLAMARDSTRFGPEHDAALAALDAFALPPRAWLDVVRATPLAPLLPCKLAPVTVLLAVVGATARTGVVRVLAASAVVTAVLATQPTTLFRLLHSVPPFDFFAGPVKFFYLTAFLVAVLAGVGVERLLSATGRRRARIEVALVVATLATSALFLAGTSALTAPASFSGGAFAPLLHEGPEAIAGGTRAARWLALAPGPPLRQIGLNYGALWDVGSLNGVGPLPAWRQLAVMEAAAPDAAVPLIRQLGADAVIVQATSSLDAQLVGAGFSARPPRSGLRAFRAPWPLPPRFQLVSEATAMGADEMIALAREGRALTRDHVALEASPPGTTWQGDVGGTLVVLQNTPERAMLRARVERPTWLVARDAYRVGWHATIDGRPAMLVPAGGFFQALLVPPGTHDVIVAYETAGLQTGAVIALLTIGLLPAVLALVLASAW